MFTGLVQAVGTVVEATPRGRGLRLAIASTLPLGEMTDGESVAVDGVCLTVAARSGDRFWADAVAETLSRTTLGRIRVGHKVNLERALSLTDRLGGHLLQGHVDLCAPVRGWIRRKGDVRLRVGLPSAVRRYVPEKGSVALNGVSLTVAAARRETFEVALVPETLSRTNLASLRPGDEVNLEVDLVARYLEALLEAGSSPSGRTPRAPGRTRGSGGGAGAP
jgi:riboflavin synthase